MAVSPFLVLQARAEARAILYRAGLFELEEAIAPLRRYALDVGIVDKIGADGVMALVDTIFGIEEQEQDEDHDA